MAEGRRALTLPSLPARPVSNLSRPGAMAADAAPAAVGAMAADAAPLAVGEWLRFKWPDGRRFSHRFWTSHPGDPLNSRLVLRHESLVNLREPIRVREVKTATCQDHGVAVRFVAVRFTNANDGRSLWTNYSQDGRAWMLRGRWRGNRRAWMTSPPSQRAS